jgi:hypothetical protein
MDMNKQDVIQRLNSLDCEIAEVMCDICSNGEKCYPNESIIVLLVSEPSNDDLIKNNLHWTICESIDDFDEGIVYGQAEAKEKYCNYYVSEFHDVKPFVSDFKNIKPNNGHNKHCWYRADFEAEIDGEKHYPDAEYFVAANDDDAIDYAKHLASQGWDYVDVDHHVEGELVSVTLVDSENEFVDIKTIWE